MAVHSARADQGEEALEPYRVSVFQNGPGSAALLSGDTAAAIEIAENALRLPQPFAALANLCAAHLAAGNLRQAESYCQRALLESQLEGCGQPVHVDPTVAADPAGTWEESAGVIAERKRCARRWFAACR